LQYRSEVTVRGELNVYIALEGDDDELIVNGPLWLLERLAAALGARNDDALVWVTIRDEASSGHAGAARPMLARPGSKSR
jgi:hypothetical protein